MSHDSSMRRRDEPHRHPPEGPTCAVWLAVGVAIRDEIENRAHPPSDDTDGRKNLLRRAGKKLLQILLPS